MDVCWKGHRNARGRGAFLAGVGGADHDGFGTLGFVNGGTFGVFVVGFGGVGGEVYEGVEDAPTREVVARRLEQNKVPISEGWRARARWTLLLAHFC